MKNIKVLFTGLILFWSVSVGYSQCNWAPTDLGSSLALWLDGSDAASMTQSGGLVSQWNDKSGNARHATQATSGSRPTYTASGLNGKSVLTFDGSDDNMSISAPFTNNAGTALIVYKPNNDNQYCLFTGSNDSWSIWDGNNNSYESTFRSVRLEGATNQISTNAANIFMIEASSVLPSYKMYKDGTTIYSSAAAFTFQNNITLITGNRFLNGFVCEVILIDNVLTQSNREKIEGYLAEKWGLTANLPSGHPYKTVAPTGTASAGAAVGITTVGVNAAMSAVTHTTVNATGIGTATGLPPGVSAAWASSTITISGTPTAVGVYNYAIPLTSSCGSANATGTITVKTAPGGVADQLSVWLKADAGVSSIGTSWQDQSGNGRHYTTVAGPTVIANDAGGNNIPAVEILSGGFNGPAGAALGTSWTLFSVHRLLPSDADGRLIDANSGNNLLANWSTGSNGIFLNGNPNVLGGIHTTTNTQTKTLYCYSRDNVTGNIIVRVNGVLLQTLTGTNTGSGIIWDLNQGENAGETSDSRMGEFIIYNKALNSTEIANVESYLITKFCINGNMTTGAASSTPTLCLNVALTNITHTTTNATGIGTATGLPAGVTAAWSSNTITISGTPTASGTFNYSIPLTGGCGSVSATGTITVGTAVNTAGAASSTPTVCANTALTNITRTTTNATGIGTATGLPAGVTAAWASNTITVSGTPTAGGTFNYTVPLTGGCGTVNATGTITVTINTAGAASSTPTLNVNTALTNITHTTTGATGIGTAVGLPAGVTAAWASNTITISGTPTASGNYNYSIPLTGGCGTVNATGTITVAAFPGGVSSQLNVWLRADAGVSAIGTSWQDQSGLGRNYTTVAGPTVIASDAGANNQPTIEILSGGFDGPAGAAIGTSWTLFSVHRLLASDADGRLIDGATGNNLLANWSTASNGIHLDGNPSLLNTGVATTTNTQTNQLYCYSRDNATGNIIVRVNGTLLQTFTSTNTGNGLVWDLGQGAFAGESSDARIGEFMIYNRALSGAEITNVETYLKNKFCLTGGATMTVGAASSTPTVGLNTVITNITHTTTNATGIGTATGLPAGVSVAWANNTITISGTPTATGTFTYSIPLRGACGTVNATGTITVIASNTAGVASSTPTLCINTALTNITHATTGATGISNSGVSGGNGLPAGVSAAWSGNVITISGTPTAAGTFAYSIPLTGGFGGSVNATGTITVTAANTVAAGSSAPSLCINTALTNITHATTGATGISNSGVSGGNGLPTGVSAAWSGNVITISGTPTAAGTFNYSIPLTGGCGTVNATGTITVSPATVGGSVSGTATVCPGSNSATLTLSGHTGSVVRWESSSASNFASPTTISSTATSYTYTNISSLTYYRAVVQSGTCSSSNSSAATITTSTPVDGGTIGW